MDCNTPGFPVLPHLPSLLKLMSIESVMLSNYLILCCPLLLSSISPINQGLFQRVGSSHQVAKALELQLQHQFPSSEYSGLISFRIGWFDLLAIQGTLESLQRKQFPSMYQARQKSFTAEVSRCPT